MDRLVRREIDGQLKTKKTRRGVESWTSTGESRMKAQVKVSLGEELKAEGPREEIKYI